MELAKTATLRCQDPYVQVGCCCLRVDNSVASLGYNGPPPGVEVDWSNRGARRKRMLHAEANALRYCSPGEVKLMAVTVVPCLSCLALIAGYRIKEVYYLNEWENADPDTKIITKELGINLIKL